MFVIKKKMYMNIYNKNNNILNKFKTLLDNNALNRFNIIKNDIDKIKSIYVYIIRIFITFYHI